MTHYEFEPGRKTDRNKYVGSWTETPATAIDLPFSVDNLRRVLAVGADSSDSTYTHQQIAQWCERYFMRFYTDENIRDRSVDFEVAEDVSVQWDLFLANTYTLAELQSLDFTSVELPAEWFAKWHAKLDAVGG